MNRKILSRYKENYRARGIGVPLIDFIRISSRKYDFLTAIDRGELKHYIADGVLLPIFKTAVKLCRNNKLFSEYINALTGLVDELTGLLDNILHKDILTAGDWRRALRVFERSVKYYLTIDFDYYSDADLSTEAPGTKKNFKKLLKFKNEARKRLVNRILMGSDCYFDRLVMKISKQFGLRGGVVNFYTIQEVYDLFQGKRVNTGTIKARKDVFVIYIYNTKIYRAWGAPGRRIIDFLEKDSRARGSIKGVVAFRATYIVRGRVRIVKLNFKKMGNISDVLKGFRAGDILVADATSPEMLPIMKKAAAIVTDFGGLNTHAAILARELKVPCVIGTKNATRILKDGDEIEVDTSGGNVKIVNVD